jgi:hypothetical protein
MALLLWLLACAPAGRTCPAGDADCDGVPDAADRCPGSNAEQAIAEPTDAAGCTDDQMARCTVALDQPLHSASASGSATFAWHGTCDVYLLQFSDEPTFPAGRTRTEIRTAQRAWAGAGTERWWRVVGGRTGSSRGFTSEPREIHWQ